MKSNFIVTGSIAYDRISVFEDHFGTHILSDHVHNINVSWQVEKMEVNFGGTGGNIAYNLGLLGESPILLGAVGKDAKDYLAHLKKHKINTTYIKRDPKLLTATATIMTDLDDNQIASFYMGANKKARLAKISAVKEKPLIAILAPNEPEAMLAYSDYCFKNDIPFIADPGQAITAFDELALQQYMLGAHVLIANDYEWQLIQEKTGWTLAQTLENVNFLVVTYGAKGSKIWCRDATVFNIPAVQPKAVVDPTGVGDAYRAGLMLGFKLQLEIDQAAQIGAWLAAKCVEVRGAQNHKVSKTDFNKFLKTL